MSEMNATNQETGLEVAVIGMTGRFPGARNIREFWENLKNGKETIRFFQDEELLESGILPEVFQLDNYVRAKGFLEGVEYFDAAFFDYSKREAEVMDPQIRIFHESVWEVLETAGYDPENYKGIIGIYAGDAFHIDWLTRVFTRPGSALERYEVGTLTDRDFLSTRVSYKLNLNGPAITVQTACSTSLVGIHLACQAIISGECGIAIAGGVSISNSRKSGYLYHEGMIFSPDGHCRAFDEKAMGTVFGNGVGVVALKLLEEALEDGDRIEAVIKGTAINNDGSRKVNFTAPSPKGQAAVIKAALSVAEVDSESITYIETHGTGTPLGDPVEIEGLNLAFNTDKRQYCRIGSAKTNVGHLDVAAGITGFIKTVLSLKHRMIPPSLNFEKPNPKIDFENSPFYVNTELVEWKAEEYPLRAGVSSFGIGGTNAHIILEEAPPRPPRSIRPNNPKLLLLSAKTHTALETMTENLARHFEENPGINIEDVAFTLKQGRRAFKHRRVCVATDIQTAIESLKNPGGNSDTTPSIWTHEFTETKVPVNFMFPGQGAQYVNMGRELYETLPQFREEMDRCFEILKEFTEINIKEILYPHPPTPERSSFMSDNMGRGEPLCSPTRSEHEGRGESCIRPNQSFNINDTQITQPLIFIFEYSLAQLLMKWGIQPYAMIGHSIGEYVAACLSGVFTLEQGIKIVCHRGKLMQQMDRGTMLSIPLSEEELTPLMQKRVKISLAAVNGPTHCVVSGPEEEIQEFSEELKGIGFECRNLHTSHAFHSHMMEPMLEKFRETMIQIGLKKPEKPYISNLTGRWITVEEATNPEYWIRHLRETIRFYNGIGELLKKEKGIYLEIGPGRVLSTFVSKHPSRKKEQKQLNLVRHPMEKVTDQRFLMEKMGKLWMYGTGIDWQGFYEDQMRQRVLLPTYPFERKRFWIEMTQVPVGVEQQTPLQLIKKAEIQEWFYIPQWIQKPIQNQTQNSKPEKNRWLLFLNENPLGNLLSKELRNRGHEVIIIRPGNEYKEEKNGEYTLHPSRKEDYHKLIQKLKQERWEPQQILLWWNVTAKEEEGDSLENLEKIKELGFYSLLEIVRSFASHGLTGQLRFNVITNRMHTVTGEEEVEPAKSLALGAVKVIAREYNNMDSYTIDIETNEKETPGESPFIIISQLLEEMMNRIEDHTIAYRGEKRYVLTYKPVKLPKIEKEKSRLRERGVYLLTGGLGGIGKSIAEYLAAQYQARLILVDRTELPPKENWEDYIREHPPEEPTVKNLQDLHRIINLGAEVEYYQADITNPQQMEEVIKGAEKKPGEIQGVLHAAGLADMGGIIQGRDRESMEQVLEPKVKGTWVLDKVLESRKLDFILLFSSISTVLPPFGEVAYCAANSYLDAFVQNKASSKTEYKVVNWEAWKEKGMAQEALQRLRAHKPQMQLTDPLKHGILTTEGVEAFERLINSEHPQVVVCPTDLNQRLKAQTQHITKGKAPKPEPGAIKAEEKPIKQEGIDKILAEVWQQHLELDEIGPHDNFFDLGADSMDILQVNHKLKDKFKKEIPIVTFYTYPTIKTLKEYLIKEQGIGFSEEETQRLETRAAKDRKQLKQEEIAVIGMSGRFPGSRNIEEYWENLEKGKETISFFSNQELLESGVDKKLLENPNYVKAKGYIEEIESFDAVFFDYKPTEAETLDPQIRVFQECVWEALEDAGYTSHTYPKSIGLYAGASDNVHWRGRVLMAGKEFPGMLLSNKDIMCTQISYKLNLKGPSFSLQTACSTALVAVHLACQALKVGECDMALAGGVSVTLPKKSGYMYMEGMMLSPDGHNRAFDAKANGTIFSNGAGVVLLKPLKEAQADRDHIYAVIKGTAINNDGERKVGYTAPSTKGQAEVIRAALQTAEVEPESVTYIETHGTGTPLGDPIEIEALKLAYKTEKRGYCKIGSVKSNIGHLDAAAGSASLIKTILSINKRRIVPSLYYETPNPKVDFENSPFQVSTELKEWRSHNGEPLRAGVSSFGFGGTNAHVILQEAPPHPPTLKECGGGAPPHPDVKRAATTSTESFVVGQDQCRGEVPSPIEDSCFPIDEGGQPRDLSHQAQITPKGSPELLLLSAKTPTSLERMTKNLANHLTQKPGINLADAAYTLQVGRRNCQYRRMLVCNNTEDAVESLSTLNPAKVKTLQSKQGISDPSIVFMYPGQGAQYINMGLELYENVPQFREEMDRCFDILEQSTLIDYDIKEVLYPTHPPALKGCGAGAARHLNVNRDATTSAEDEGRGEPLCSPSNDLISISENNGGESCIHPNKPIIPDSQRRGKDEPPASLTINDTQITQPVIFMVEYSLSRLLISWGIQPTAMIGHSIGEYTAACIAGVFTLEEALELVVLRGQLMQRMPRGTMLSVPLSEKDLKPLLWETISLAAVNGPTLCVVSGTTEDIEAFSKELEQKEIATSQLHTSHAFHSEMMDPILEEYQEKVNQLKLKEPALPYISNLTGDWITTEQATSPGYWARHLRETVNFSKGIKELLKKEKRTFIEVGPGRVLSTLVKKHTGKKSGNPSYNLIRHPNEEVTDTHYLLEKIGQLWLRGIEIDWEGYYSQEQRNRISLPTYAFDRQYFWIEEGLEQTVARNLTKKKGVLKKKNIRDWFYVPQWESSEIEKTEPLETPPGERWLVFEDETGLTQGIKKTIEGISPEIITVKSGTQFKQETKQAFTIEPGSRADYIQLFEELRKNQQLPEKIIHLWNVTEIPGKEPLNKQQEKGLYSLLEIAYAVGKLEINHEMKLEIVTTNMQRVSGNTPLYPEKATLLGPVKVIPREYPNLQTRSIDLDWEEIKQQGNLAISRKIVEEIHTPIKHIEVAYRKDRRYTKIYEAQPLEAKKDGKIPLKKKGVYLVTGGFGGIGYVICKELAEKYQARLIILGRSPIPPRKDWEHYLKNNESKETLTQRIKKALELEKLGAEVWVLTAEISDETQVKAVIHGAEQTLGTINGVFHTAGIADYAGIIQLRDKTETEKVLLPKLKGTLALEKALKNKKLEFFILFSSISSIMGPFGEVGYAAANAYLDAYALSKTKNRNKVITINWDAWQEVGMAVESVNRLSIARKEQAKIQLEAAILPNEGIEALYRIFNSPYHQVVVSPAEIDITKVNQLIQRQQKKVEEEKPQEPKHSRKLVERPELETTYVGPDSKTEKMLAELWQQHLGIEQIGIHDNFFDLGANSLDIIQVNNQLKKIINKEISVVTFYTYPTISTLHDYLKKGGEIAFSFEETQRLKTKIQGKVEKKEPTNIKKIAIIGMSGRFPGADTIQTFWENLLEGKETIRFFKDQELEEAGVSTQMLQDSQYVKAKGYIENIEYFDAEFFDYKPAEAVALDPQIRIFQECVWESLEHSGYNPVTYEKLIGLYAGASDNIQWRGKILLNDHGYTGFLLSNKDILCTQTSYKLNLQGPSFSLQTACSTSLLAVHLACQGLINKECDIALAGGVSITLPNKSGYLYEDGMINSPDGHCRVFDAKANGTVFSNGAGIVALKRLQEALEDNDTIHAVLLGTAINNDGERKVGFTAPSTKGQAEVIRTAIQVADVEPETITYVETHGTGTNLGDPIEIEALKLAFATEKKGYCKIGSVKSNIGHLDTAAGVASLIKAIQCLENRMIPASLHFTKANPKIDFDKSPFEVNTELFPWVRENQEQPLRAGVSSFGYGGTNAHVILEEAPTHPPTLKVGGSVEPPHLAVNRDATNSTESFVVGQDQCRGEVSSPARSEHDSRGESRIRPNNPELLLLSAKTSAALEAMTENLATHFEENPGVNLKDAAYTLQVGRKASLHRRMLVSGDPKDAAEQLRTLNATRLRTATLKEEKDDIPVVFMFPGQGAQYVEMGKTLYEEEPLFREEMDRCFDVLENLEITKYNLKYILYPNLCVEGRGATLTINDTQIAQPLIFIFEYTLARLLMKRGIKPYAMIGHSIGEYTAACLSGVMSLEQALKLVVRRGQLMQQQGLETTRLHTSHAFHSPMMEPILEEYEEEVKKILMEKPIIPYISNLTGTWITAEQVKEPTYWIKHLRHTVRFSEGLTELLKEEKSLFLEVGPGRVLSTLVTKHITHKKEQRAINLVRHPQEQNSETDIHYLLDKIGQLWLKGLNIDWKTMYTNQKRKRIPMPTYPFDRKYYWPKERTKGGIGIYPGQTFAQKRKDLTQWLYIPTWKRSPLLLQTQQKTVAPCLIFTGTEPLGKELKQELEKQGNPVIQVTEGTTFTPDGEKGYIINPSQDTDYETLMQELKNRQLIPANIIHLWSIQSQDQEGVRPEDVSRTMEVGYYSLLSLARAIGKKEIQEQIQITIITHGLQDVIGEAVTLPQQAILQGPVTVIPKEYPNIQCKMIDIELPEPGTPNPGKTDHQLIKEAVTRTQENVIAYRNHIRWIREYEPITIPETDIKLTGLKERGTYLITGGMGGIGLVIAGYLARKVKARLILMSRTGLPPREEWENWLNDHPEEDITSQKINKIKQLQAVGSEVQVLQADVSQPQQIETAVKELEKRFGQVNGVIHAAGLPDAGLIQGRTRQASQAVFAAKVKGTMLIDKALKEHPLDFFILCSSTASILSPAGQVGYTSANAFLDAYASYKYSLNGTRVTSINWDAWQEVGMAVKAEAQFKGKLKISLADGILPFEGEELFARILSGKLPQVITSTRDLHQVLRELREIENHQTDTEKEIGESKQPHQPSSPKGPGVLAPRNQVEKILTQAWRDVLGIEEVEADDNFFDLGATSLDIIQANRRLKQNLQVNLPVVVFYNYPTITELAKYISKDTPSKTQEAEKEQFKSISKGKNKLRKRGKRMETKSNG
jgi:acyl transferase domain-containing protein/acyl carrier protein